VSEKTPLLCRLGLHSWERTGQSSTEHSDFYDFGSRVRWTTRLLDEMRCTRCDKLSLFTVSVETTTTNEWYRRNWVRDQIALGGKSHGSQST
jgi:hypothetical protein